MAAAAGKGGRSAHVIQHKKSFALENIYSNDRGSHLLADARAGALRTRLYRKKYQTIDTKCPDCKQEDENLEHILLYCPASKPVFEGLVRGCPQQEEKMCAALHKILPQ